MYHTTTWLLWLIAALLPAMLTRNPLYLIILLLGSGLAGLAGYAGLRIRASKSKPD